MTEFLMSEQLMPIMSFLTPIMLVVIAFLAKSYIASLDKKFKDIDERFGSQESRFSDLDKTLNSLSLSLASTSATSSTERGYADRDLQEVKQALIELDKKLESVLVAHLTCPGRDTRRGEK